MTVTPARTSHFRNIALPALFAGGVGLLVSAAARPSASNVAAPPLDAGRYSSLSQINRSNVGSLAVAWTYRVDDANPERFSTIECTPVFADDVLYLTSA